MANRFIATSSAVPKFAAVTDLGGGVEYAKANDELGKGQSPKMLNMRYKRRETDGTRLGVGRYSEPAGGAQDASQMSTVDGAALLD